MVEVQKRGFFIHFCSNTIIQSCFLLILCCIGTDLKHAGYTFRARQCLGHGHDQIRQLHQFYQDLVHIVDDRYHLTLA